MNKKDKYYVGLIEDYNFRFVLVDCSEAISEIVINQSLKYSSADLLAKALVGSFFLAGLVKDDTKVSIQLEGEGKIERAIAYSSRDGKLKGLVKNKEVIAEIGDPTIGIGKGVFRVYRWNGSQLLSQSITTMQEIDFENNLLNYIYDSDQVASYFHIYLNNKNSKPVVGGFIFQALPGASDNSINKVRSSISGLMSSLDNIFLGNLEDSIKILEDNLGASFTILQEGIPTFCCDCSLDKIKSAVKAIGKEEAFSIIEEIGKVELVCEFCNTHYSLDLEEVKVLFL